MNQSINVSFTLCSIIFMIIINLVYFSKKRIKSKENRVFSRIMVLTLIGTILELSNFVLQKNGVKFDSFIYYLDIRSILMYYVLWGGLLFYYIVLISGKDISFSYKLAFLFIMTMIYMVLPLEYKNVNDIMIASGMATTFVYGLFLVFIFSGVVLMLFNIKKTNIKKYMPLFALITIGIVLMYVQYKNPAIITMSFVNCIIVYLMYFTLENPDLKMLELVNEAKMEVELTNKSKSDFLINMSHEIRTPLNAIVGFSEAIKEEDSLDKTKEEAKDIILAANNLLEIVNGVLDVSLIEDNHLVIVDKEYKVKELFEELILLTKKRIGDKKIDFKVNIDPSIPSKLYGDGVRLRQVILNLLDNAVKYTKEGYINLSVDSVINGNVCRLIISVEDTGIGIKKEDINKLFSNKKGVGLTVNQKLVDLMGGKIIVQSVYGQGSKFTVSVDHRTVLNVFDNNEALVDEAIDKSGARVLIVDDNELNIKVATTLLKKYNLVTESSTSALDCLNKVKSGERYDLILLDDLMPLMNGREIISKLKEIKSFNTPVVVLTANATNGMKDKYLSIGFDDYLSKPIEKKELERIIKAYIKTRSYNDVVLPSTSNQEEKTGIKVLLVDDNEVNLKLMESILVKKGFIVDKVNNGKDAIFKCIDNKYDVILMDDMMPDLDGCQTLKELKSIDGFNSKVLLNTASKIEEVEDKIKVFGFDGYLSKPMNKKTIEEVIKNTINKNMS